MFLAWVIPVFAVVAAVNWLISRRLSARPPAPTGRPPPALRGVLAYSLTDWTASTARTVVIGVLPLVVLAQLGSSESAYYFLAWTIAYSVYLLSANVGDALLAEASYDEANVDRDTLHSGLLSLAVSLPVVVVAAVLAPYVLRVFGPEYADGATTTVRLLLIAALPNIITRTYLGKLRAERRMATVVGYEVALSVGVLLLSVLLLGPMGIAGLGAAWLVMLTLAGLYAVAVESVWWWLPRLDPERVTAVERRGDAVRRVAMRLPSRRLDRQVRASLRHRYSSRPSWRRIASTDHLQTVSVDGAEGRPPLRFELALTSWGNEILARRNRAVAELVDRPGIASLRPLLPYPIEHDRSGDRHVMIESAVSGARGPSWSPPTPSRSSTPQRRGSPCCTRRPGAGWFSTATGSTVGCPSRSARSPELSICRRRRSRRSSGGCGPPSMGCPSRPGGSTATSCSTTCCSIAPATSPVSSTGSGATSGRSSSIGLRSPRARCSSPQEATSGM